MILLPQKKFTVFAPYWSGCQCGHATNQWNAALNSLAGYSDASLEWMYNVYVKSIFLYLTSRVAKSAMTYSAAYKPNQQITGKEEKGKTGTIAE